MKANRPTVKADQDARAWPISFPSKPKFSKINLLKVNSTTKSANSPFTSSGDKIHNMLDQRATEEARPPTFVEACGQCDEIAITNYLKDDSESYVWNSRDKTGKTGLSHACANGFFSIVRLLLQKQGQIDVNLADNEGNTPLIFASQAGHFEIVKMLVNKFTDVQVDQCNNQGFTALMKAAIQGRSRCAKVLLYAGASPHKRDFGRKLCAMEWAEYCSRLYCTKTINRFVEACESGIMCRDTFPTGSELDLNIDCSTSKHRTDVVRNKKTSIQSLGKSNTRLSLGHKKLSRFCKSDSNLACKHSYHCLTTDDSDNDSCDHSPSLNCVRLKFRSKKGHKVSNAAEYSSVDPFMVNHLDDVSKFLFLPALAMGANFSRGHRTLRGFSPPLDDFGKSNERRSRSLVCRDSNRKSQKISYSRASTPGGGSSPTGRLNRIQVPKLKVTLISKDDNFYCESSLQARSRIGHLATSILRKISL